MNKNKNAIRISKSKSDVKIENSAASSNSVESKDRSVTQSTSDLSSETDDARRRLTTRRTAGGADSTTNWAAMLHADDCQHVDPLEARNLPKTGRRLCTPDDTVDPLVARNLLGKLDGEDARPTTEW